MSSSIPEFKLVRASGATDEWPVDRSVLLDIAPDREALIVGSPSIRDIREAIKIRISEPCPSHWLYQKTEKKHVKLTDPTGRLPAVRKNSGTWPRQHNSSRSPLSPSRVTNTSWSPMTWGRSNLSTTDKLISPRPLGPTHLLVAYAEPPSPQGVYPLLTELPINALVFATHCPNLRAPPGTRLPHRLPHALPRVLVRVRSIAALAPLVVFLHTKNQAELFRALLPRWIGDLLHPLPLLLGLPGGGAVEPGARSVEAVVRELVLLAADDELVRASTTIAALKDNLEDIGLREPALSNEVEMTYDILIKAVKRRAQAPSEDDYA